MKVVRYVTVIAVAAAALVVPTGAFAHGTVYTGEGRIVTSLTGVTPVTVGPQVRHMITNHGFTMVLRETNGADTKGMVSYAMLPGAYRNQAGFEPGAPGTRTRTLSEGDTGAQPHATCRGVAALDAESAVLGWQGTDPFYNYVPFQKEAAGLEDDPALWIEDVLALTGVDLASVPDIPAACAGLGGTYVPADETQSTALSLASGTLHPFEEEIALLNDEVAGLQEQLAAANGGASASSSVAAENASLKSQVAKLKLEATRLKIGSVSGNSVKLSGPAGKAVALKLTVSKKVAKSLKLKSRTVGAASGKIGSGAAATIAVKASSKALAKGSLKVTVTATCEDRVATSSATLKK